MRLYGTCKLCGIDNAVRLGLVNKQKRVSYSHREIMPNVKTVMVTNIF